MGGIRFYQIDWTWLASQRSVWLHIVGRGNLFGHKRRAGDHCEARDKCITARQKKKDGVNFRPITVLVRLLRRQEQ
jgi:hypothetical protein